MGVAICHIHRSCSHTGAEDYVGHVHLGMEILEAVLEFCLYASIF